MSLVRRARRENRTVVVSLFVNPTQFGPGEDYRTYPRTFRRDCALLRREKVDVLLAPKASDVYPEDFQTQVAVGRLSKPLCGISRPTHFGGVATVVLKLLERVRPDALYLGQKDYQQYLVVRQLVLDLDVPVSVRLCPIVREKDGLAMSSRNVKLSPAERQEALVLYRALREADRAIRGGCGDAGAVRRILRRTLRQARGARVDYAEVVDGRTLEPVVELNKGRLILLALAVFFGRTRLIDNHLLRV